MNFRTSVLSHGFILNHYHIPHLVVLLHPLSLSLCVVILFTVKCFRDSGPNKPIHDKVGVISNVLCHLNKPAGTQLFHNR